MGALKEKPVEPSATRFVVGGAPLKAASEVVKTRSFGNLTAGQEALYGAISSDKKNNLDAAAARAAKHAARK